MAAGCSVGPLCFTTISLTWRTGMKNINIIMDTILKVAEEQFDRNIEKYVEKSVDEYAKRVKEPGK